MSKKAAGGNTALEICTELICCHKREQEEQDLVQIGQAKTEEPSSTAEASTTTGEEGAGVTSSGLAVVLMASGSRLAGVVTTLSGLPMVGTIRVELAGVVTSSNLL